MLDDALPEPPRTMFASDNASGIHPRYLDAIARANEGHQLAYGDDPFTATAKQMFRDLCGTDVSVLFCFGGTGANVLALSLLLERGESIICTSKAHISVDETGAPEKILGVKLHSLPTTDGKLSPSHIHELARELGNMHHVQPGVVSISQPTELGTLYSIDEIADIVEAAHSYGMRVHVDGARIANAVAALGVNQTTNSDASVIFNSSAFRAMTFDLGVDAVSFGGTKNAMLHAEVVLMSPTPGGPHVYGAKSQELLVKQGAYMRKQVTQLPSKMRFNSVQFIEAFTDDLWLQTAHSANGSARLLYESLADLSELGLQMPQVNSLYPLLPDPAKSYLQSWCFFWDWDRSIDQVRWMTSWDTTTKDIERFSTGVRAALAH